MTKILNTDLHRDALLLADGSGPVTAAETPIEALFREWVIAHDEEEQVYTVEPTGNGDTPECLAATEAVKAIEKKIADTPARDYRDFVLKIAATTNFGQWAPPGINGSPKMWAEARALLGVPA